MDKEDQILREFFQESNEINSPSMRFTKNIMDAIEAKEAIKPKALINKTGWFIIAILLTATLLLSLFPSKTDYLQEYFSFFDSNFTEILPHIYIPLIGLIIGIVFIYADKIWRKRKTPAPLA